MAAVVSVIWLGVLGHFWWAIGCIVVSLFAAWPLGFVMMPGMVFATLALRAEQRGAAPGRLVLLAVPAQVYAAGVITVWCMSVLMFLLQRANSETWIPLMLLSFAAGTFPFDYMASKDRNNPDSGSFTLMFFTKAAFVAVMAYVALARPDSVQPLWVLFAGIMLLGIGLASAEAYFRARRPAAPSPRPAVRWNARLKGLFRRKPPAYRDAGLPARTRPDRARVEAKHRAGLPLADSRGAVRLRSR